MKRDMDLVRNILLALESTEKPLDGPKLRQALETVLTDVSSVPSSQVLLDHVTMMKEEGLVSANFIRSTRATAFMGLKMTWAGHDFLEKARDPTIWEKARPKVESLSFDLAKQLLLALIRGGGG